MGVTPVSVPWPPLPGPRSHSVHLWSRLPAWRVRAWAFLRMWGCCLCLSSDRGVAVPGSAGAQGRRPVFSAEAGRSFRPPGPAPRRCFSAGSRGAQRGRHRTCAPPRAADRPPPVLQAASACVLGAWAGGRGLSARLRPFTDRPLCVISALTGRRRVGGFSQRPGRAAPSSPSDRTELRAARASPVSTQQPVRPRRALRPSLRPSSPQPSISVVISHVHEGN